MADGVHVRFTADVSDFIAALDNVSSKTSQSAKFQQEHGDEIEKVAKAYGDLRAALDPSVASAANFQRAMDLNNAALQTGLINEEQFAEQTAKINDAFNGAADGAKKAGAAHEEFSLQTAGARREVIVLGHEIVTGNFARIPGSLIVMAERAGGVSLGMLGMAGALAAVGVVLGEVLIKQERWAETLARSQALLENSGRASLFDRQMLEQYADQLEHTRGVNAEAAQQILVTWAGIGSATPEIIQKLNTSIDGFTVLTGEKAPEAAKTLAKAIENPSRAIEELAAKHVQLDADTIRLIDTQQREGEVMAARTTLVSALAEKMQQAVATGVTPFQQASHDAANALLDLGTAFAGPETHSSILATAMLYLATVLRALSAPAAIAGKAFFDLIDIVSMFVHAIQGAIDSINVLSSVAATGFAGIVRAAASAARGDLTGAADILKNIPADVAASWRTAADQVSADIAKIRQAQTDMGKPYLPGSAPKPPTSKPVASADDGDTGESKSEQALKLNQILDRTLTARRDLVQIGDDETRIQTRLNEVLEESKTATAERRAQIGDEVNRLTEALALEEQRRAAIENRDKPKGGASQLDTWRTELAQRKAGEDQFHQISAADEAAFWQQKIALTTAGSKEREAVEKEYYAAVARARGQELADQLDDLKQQITHEGATVDQRVGLLAQYHAAYTSKLAEGTAAFRAAKDFELAETKRIEDEKLKAAEKGIDDQIKAIERQAGQVQRALDTQVKIKGETNEQELQATIANLDRQYQAERDLLDKELALSGLSLQDKQRINDQLEALDDKYNSAVIQAAQKMVEAQGKAWDALVGPVDRAVDQSVTGVLTGTQTAQQAIARAGQSIVASFASDGVKLATDFIKSQVMMTTETAAQTKARELLQTLSTTTDAATIRKAVAAFTAAESTKTSVSAAGTSARNSIGETENAGFFTRVADAILEWLGLESSKTEASTSGTAARATAETTANSETLIDTSITAAANAASWAAVAATAAMASVAAIPFVGWAMAPEVGAETYAQGLIYAGLASAAGGWDRVPYDGALTELHKDEMVLPASIASPLRGMLSGYKMPTMAGGAGSITPKASSGAGPASAGGPIELHAHIGSINGGNVDDVQHAVLSTLDNAARNGVPKKYRHLHRMMSK